MVTQNSVCWNSSLPPGGKPRFLGCTGSPFYFPPNSSSYWPKVSAPSGKLTSNWAVPDHMTPLSGAGNQGRPKQVQLKAEAGAGSGNALAGRGPVDLVREGGYRRGRAELKGLGSTGDLQSCLSLLDWEERDHRRLFPKQELALSPPGKYLWP